MPPTDEAVEGAVALNQIGAVRAGELAKGVVERLGRKVRVQSLEGASQAARQDNLGVATALGGGGGVRGDVRTVGGVPAHGLEPVEGGVLDGGFGEGGGQGDSQRNRMGTACSRSPNGSTVSPS